MKRLTTLVILLNFVIHVHSQIINKIDTYKLPERNEVEKIVTITMLFGKPNSILIAGDTAEIRNAGDVMIDIVCTDFPSTSSLTKLNKERILEFYRIFPFINPKQVLKIRVIRQMDGMEKGKAQEMFHGLIIKFRPPQTKETMIHDLTKIEEILKIKDSEIVNRKNYDSFLQKRSKVIKNEPEHKKDTLAKAVLKKKNIDRVVSIAGVSNLKVLIKNYGNDSSCYLVITPQEALKQGYITKKEYQGGNGRTSSKAIGWRAHELIAIFLCNKLAASDSVKVEKDFYPLTIDSTSITKYSLNKENYPLPDSTLFKVFKRNKWINMDIVGDVTGSMYPYTAQLLLWLKLQSLDSLTTNYTFFNDGDNLPDKRKKIGKTGGIYSKVCTSFSEVLELVKTTMMNGGGGDCPENNTEALINAEKKYPENNFHVLIADNWARIKDFSLAKSLKKPVRVVLCGVSDNAINSQYLDLARLTKGSVHLMENDLFNLATLHEGETISIGKRQFKLINGRFIDITEKIEKKI